mgnify:CR=1 FL=1
MTSPQAFEGLKIAGREVSNPDSILATLDHCVPTRNRHLPIADPIASTTSSPRSGPTTLSPTGSPSTSPIGSVSIGHPAIAGAEVTRPPVKESPPASRLRHAGPYAGATPLAPGGRAAGLEGVRPGTGVS